MVRVFYFLLIVGLTAGSCSSHKGEDTPPAEETWSERKAIISSEDSLFEGSTYLSVYSQVYSVSEHRIHNLTAIVSLRNTSRLEKVYIKKAEYFNTEGKVVKTYIKEPIFINPMETVEILIFIDDEQGGTGGNFIFDWASPLKENKPYFEAVMISTVGQQGLSFSTRGVDL